MCRFGVTAMTVGLVWMLVIASVGSFQITSETTSRARLLTSSRGSAFLHSTSRRSSHPVAGIISSTLPERRFSTRRGLADVPVETTASDETVPLPLPEIPQPPKPQPMVQLALAGSLATIMSDMIMHPYVRCSRSFLYLCRRLFHVLICYSSSFFIHSHSLNSVDCIKTLQQSDDGMHLSLVQAAQYLFQTSGVAGFYHGFWTYAITDSLGGAFKFAVWEGWKQQQSSLHAWWTRTFGNSKQQTTIASTATAATTTSNTSSLEDVSFLLMGAALAFVASSVLIVPGEFLKQQLQMSRYDTLWQAVDGTLQQSGLGGFFAGYEAVLYRDIPYTMLELGLYEIFKNQLLNYKTQQHHQHPHTSASSSETPKLSTFDEVVAAAVTGAITAIATTPLDTVKTKMMVDAEHYGSTANFLETLLTSVDEYGWTSVFAGVVARVCWIVPFVAMYLPSYDFFKRQLAERMGGGMNPVEEQQ